MMELRCALRRLVYFNHWTLLQLGLYIWKTGVLGKLYHVRSTEETRLVRWLIYLENGSTWQAVLRTVR